MTSSPVVVHLYDLSQGMARALSPAFLGKQIDGIWHTGVVVFGYEYYFGGGICSDPAGATPYGVPVQRLTIGNTTKSHTEFRAFLSSVQHRFTMHTYNLLEHNCNNFSSECVRFLCPGLDIPRFILDLPGEVMATPMGMMIRPTIDAMQQQMARMGHPATGLDSGVGGGGGVGGAGGFGGQSTATFPSSSSSSSFSPAPAAPSPAAPSPPVSSLAEAARRPVILGKGDIIQIRKKLAEFAPDCGLADGASELAAVAASLPVEQAFPALDLLRLRCAQSENDSSETASILPQLLKDYVLAENAPRPSRIMALRLACNCLAFDSAACVALTMPELLDLVGEAIAHALTTTTDGNEKSNPQQQQDSIQAAAAALAYNIGAASARGLPVGEDAGVRIAFACAEWLPSALERFTTTTASSSTSTSPATTSSSAESSSSPAATGAALLEVENTLCNVLIALGLLVSSNGMIRELCLSLDVVASLESFPKTYGRTSALVLDVVKALKEEEISA